MYVPETVDEAPHLDELTPREIVRELDKYVIGQAGAKRAVAIALRNRIRRQIVPYLEKALGRNIRQTIWRAATIAKLERIMPKWIASAKYPGLFLRAPLSTLPWSRARPGDEPPPVSITLSSEAFAVS